MVEFLENLPDLYNGRHPSRRTRLTLTMEVMQHLGKNMVRCVALASTDGLQAGMKVIDTGVSDQVPRRSRATLGEAVLMWSVEPIDEKGPLEAEEWWPIHRDPPSFEELEPSTEILATGLKVLDLLAPLPKGGKMGLFGGAGVGRRSDHGA